MRRFLVLVAYRLVAPMLVIGMAMIVGGCDQMAAQPPIPTGEWREFEGSWNATGTRRSIDLGHERTGAIIDLQGTMLLTGAGRPGVGFHAEVIGLTDSHTGLAGRSVWTDEHDDQIFSEITGEGTKHANRMRGTFIGGTGRYAGIAGTYEFSWQFVIEGDDGSIQGRATELRGRFQLAPSPESSGPR